MPISANTLHFDNRDITPSITFTGIPVIPMVPSHPFAQFLVVSLCSFPALLLSVHCCSVHSVALVFICFTPFCSFLPIAILSCLFRALLLPCLDECIAPLWVLALLALCLRSLQVFVLLQILAATIFLHLLPLPPAAPCSMCCAVQLWP